MQVKKPKTTMLGEKLQQAVRTALISVLEAEVDAFIGAVRYERTEQRRDYRKSGLTGVRLVRERKGIEGGLVELTNL